jgi:type I restriction enzyme, S subunit
MSESPADWPYERLSDIADIGTGITLGRELGDSPYAREYPYLRVANVQDGRIDISDVKQIQVFPFEFPRYRLQRGDILLTEGGDFDKLGRGAVWDGSIANCLHQNHIFRVRLRNHMVPEFFAAYMASTAGRAYFLSCAKQTTNLASINKSQLSVMPVPVPSQVQQARIAEIFDSVDELIDNSEMLLRKELANQQAMVTSLVASKDADVTMADVLGSSPKNGLYKHSSDYGEDGAAIIRIDNIQGGEIDGIEALRRVQINGSESHIFGVQRNDILINRVNTVGLVGKSAIVRDIPGPVVFESNIMRCRMKADLVRAPYVALWLGTAKAMSHFRSSAKSAIAQASINQRDVASCPVALPCLPDQDAVIAHFEQIRTAINLRKKELSKLRELKQGLTTDLLTGRVWVPEHA